jgi:hypothetical protein
MPLPDFFLEASSSKFGTGKNENPIYPVHLLQDQADNTDEDIESGQKIPKIFFKVCAFNL